MNLLLYTTDLKLFCYEWTFISVTDTKGHKITISIDGISEIILKDRLAKTTTSLYSFTESTNTDVLKVESGSIVIYLKSYDNSLMQQLENPAKDHSLLCSLIKSIIEQYDITRFVTGRHKMKVKLTIYKEDVDSKDLFTKYVGWYLMFYWPWWMVRTKYKNPFSIKVLSNLIPDWLTTISYKHSRNSGPRFGRFSHQLELAVHRKTFDSLSLWVQELICLQ